MKKIVMWVAVVVMAVVLSGCCMFSGKCGCGGKDGKSSAPTEKAK